MNTYLVQYSDEGAWIPFSIKAPSIYDVEDWFKANIQERGVSISYIDNCTPQPDPTFGEWSDEKIMERARRRALANSLRG